MLARLRCFVLFLFVVGIYLSRCSTLIAFINAIVIAIHPSFHPFDVGFILFSKTMQTLLSIVVCFRYLIDPRAQYHCLFYEAISVSSCLSAAFHPHLQRLCPHLEQLRPHLEQLCLHLEQLCFISIDIFSEFGCSIFIALP